MNNVYIIYSLLINGMKIKLGSYIALVLITFTLFSVSLTESVTEQSNPEIPLIQDSFIVDGTNWTVGCFSCHDQTLHLIGMDGFSYDLTNDSLHFQEDGGIWPNPYGTTTYTSVGAYTTFPTNDGNLVIVFNGRARAKHVDAVLLGIRIYDPSNMTWLMSSASHPENISYIIGAELDSAWHQMIINITIPGYDELAVFWSFNDFFDTDWSQEIWVENILVNPDVSEIPEPDFDPIVVGYGNIYFPSYPNWRVYDDNPANYSIFVNGTERVNKPYSTGDHVFYNIYNDIEVEPGEYNITIMVKDMQNNSVTDSVILYVSENYFEEDPPDIWALEFNLVEENYTAFLYWWATDANPDYYEIYVNDEINQTGLWTIDTAIPFKIENVSGTYNVTIVVYDINGAYDVDTFIFSLDIRTPRTDLTDFPLPILALPIISLIYVLIRRQKKKQ